MAHYSKTADPVHKISIVPRGKAALGYTLQIPVSDSYLMTETELRDRVRVLLGGRAAESLIYDEISTGAENDLQRCTSMARRMVGHFGMGKSTGLLHLGSNFRDCSSSQASQSDHEVSALLQELYEEAIEVLAEHRTELERVTEKLLHEEVLDAETFTSLLQARS